jgi:ribosome-associated protein
MVVVKELVALLQENKMKSVSVYDLSSMGDDKFVVLSSSNKIADSKRVADIIAEKYNYTGKIEGYNKGEWIVFDFVGLTLHIFLPKVRDKYNLDKLYKPKKSFPCIYKVLQSHYLFDRFLNLPYTQIDIAALLSQ